MQFSRSAAYLLSKMMENPLVDDIKNQKYHSYNMLLYGCSDGTKIAISYPGTKSTLDGKKIAKLDFKVTMSNQNYTTALSHCNIIIDIYNKIKNCGMDPFLLRSLISESMLDRRFYFSKAEILKYKPSPPPQELIRSIVNIHGDKKFNIQGNKIDIGLEIFFQSLKWIAIQEDINYPISENFMGRRLSLARYLESIAVASGATDHGIEEVVERTLSHSLPKHWEGIDYSPIFKIK